MTLKKIRQNLDKLEFDEIGDRQYCCPNCGFDPVSVDPVEISDELIKIFGIKIIWNEDKSGYKWYYAKKGKKKYPIHSDIKNAYWFNGQCWKETHYCPKCLKEFSFRNANY